MITKKCLKNSLLFLFAFMIILFSFMIPKWFLRLEDLSREKEIYVRLRKESKIDVQAEKIYLVRFIHDIYELQNTKVYYDDKKTVSVGIPTKIKTSNIALTSEVKDEIAKLINSNIIKDINFDEIIDYDETVNMFISEYTVITAVLAKENGEGLGVGIEEKTGKIISIDFPKSILRNDVARKEQLENYVKYLDLDIIDDWKYEKELLKSEKAQLSIVFEEQEDGCMLTIAPTVKYEEYENSKYEVVEKK